MLHARMYYSFIPVHILNPFPNIFPNVKFVRVT